MADGASGLRPLEKNTPKKIAGATAAAATRK